MLASSKRIGTNCCIEEDYRRCKEDTVSEEGGFSLEQILKNRVDTAFSANIPEQTLSWATD